MNASEEYIRLEDRSDLALMKDVAVGRKDAFIVLLDRYLELVSRTSFRIMCDRKDSEAVTVRVFVSMFKDIESYDDRFTLGEWLLRKTCLFCRLRMVRRRTFRIFGAANDVFVQASPKVDDQDDYVTKQAWELHCRATTHMTPLQGAAYALCALEGISTARVAHITGLTHFRIGHALHRAVEKEKEELRHYDRESDYDRYVIFLRKVAESLTDKEKLTESIMSQVSL